jgi:amino acid transporter
LIATEISAVSQLFGFEFTTDYLRRFNYPQATLGWRFGQETSPDVWVAIFLVVVLLINLLPVRIYGELEYIFGSFKMIVIVGLILFNVIINVQNAQDGRTTGPFSTYQAPYGFFSSNVTVATASETYLYSGDTGRLIGIWSAMNTIFFSLQGFFTVSITAAENKQLDRDEGIKLATRKISLRVILLYSLLVFTVGLNVPYTDYNLRDSSISSIRKGQNSPFVLAMVHSGVTGWPNFLNGFFIFSAFSTAVNGLYISSRLLHALASIQNVWPETKWAYSIKKRLERTSSHGVPAPAVFVSWLFGLLGFLGAQPSPAKILGRMAIYSTCSMLIVYICVCLSFLSFKSCTIDGDPTEEVVLATPNGIVLNRNASDYPYRSHLQWARAAYGLLGCSLLLLFNGWRSFLHPFSTADFLASYFNVFVFVVIVTAYHIKDEREWNPLRWTRRVTMDIRNPTVTREKNIELRKGRLHRANRETFFCKENALKYLEFVWAWLK